MAKLLDSEIESARSDIVAVIESFNVQLEKAGKEYRALCPFHSERSPSFTVTPALGRYYCHGCGAHGDSVQFVMDYTTATFREAVNLINGNTERDITPRAQIVIERDAKPEWTPCTTVTADAPLPEMPIK